MTRRLHSLARFPITTVFHVIHIQLVPLYNSHVTKWAMLFPPLLVGFGDPTQKAQDVSYRRGDKAVRQVLWGFVPHAVRNVSGSSPTGVHPCIYSLYLTTKYYHIHLILWLSRLENMVDNGQFMLCGFLVPHDQAFSIYHGPTASKKLFFNNIKIKC